MTELCTLIAGPKRHAEFSAIGDEIEIAERTETALGGFFADPPSMRGRAPDGGRVWTLAAIEREIRFALARQSDPNAVRPMAPWDRQGKLAFPAIRRLVVVTFEVAKTLPEPLRRPGTRYLEGIASRLRHGIDPSVVALDPGGDLSDWREFAWLDRATGARVPVTTDPEEVSAVLLDTLDQRAIDWATKPAAPPIGPITIHPDRIRLVGAVSGVIDADVDGLFDPRSHRPIYEELNRLAIVHSHAAQLGKRQFVRRTGLSEGAAQRAATGRSISDRNLRTALRALSAPPGIRICALDGCVRPITTPQARFCSKAHRDRAYRVRRRQISENTQSVPLRGERRDVHHNYPKCPHCNTVLLGLAAERGTCSRHAEAT